MGTLLCTATLITTDPLNSNLSKMLPLFMEEAFSFFLKNNERNKNDLQAIDSQG
jgi:hypothetical protein